MLLILLPVIHPICLPVWTLTMLNLGEACNCLCLFYHFSTLKWCKQLKSFLEQDNDHFIPGDVMVLTSPPPPPSPPPTYTMDQPNIPICIDLQQKCAHFCHKVVHWGIFIWCIVWFVRWVYSCFRTTWLIVEHGNLCDLVIPHAVCLLGLV